jgi:MFS family permease
MGGLMLLNLATSVFGITAAWSIAQAGYSAVFAALTALLPDQVPEVQRGRITGLIGVCSSIGAGVGVFIAGHMPSTAMKLLVPAAVGLAFMIPIALVVKDRPVSSTPLPGRAFLRAFVFNPRQHPNFAWAWLSRFSLTMALATLNAYQVYYLMDHLHIPVSAVGEYMATSTTVAIPMLMLGCAISGWLSDRLQRRKVFVLGSAFVFGCGLGLIALATTFRSFLGGQALASFSEGVYLAVDLALVTAVLPNREKDAAKDMGIFNVASALPTSVAPALAPLFLGLGGGRNYVALFFVAAAYACVGALAVQPISGVR